MRNSLEATFAIGIFSNEVQALGVHDRLFTVAMKNALGTENQK